MKNKVSYPGNELDLFKNAINWKLYWIKYIEQYITGDVLEVGAGNGINTKIIMNNIDSIKSYTSIEPDKDLFKESKIIDIKENSNLFQYNCLLNELDKKNKYDTILYIDVIEHIENDAKELIEAKSFLKEGGNLVILVPAFNSAYSEFDKKINHYRRYTKKTLKKVLPADLSLQKIRYQDSLGLILSYINKYILKQPEPNYSQIIFWDKVIVPISKVFDKIINYAFGKSLIGIWRNEVNNLKS